jgi:hypothetical protein
LRCALHKRKTPGGETRQSQDSTLHERWPRALGDAYT